MYFVVLLNKRITLCNNENWWKLSFSELLHKILILNYLGDSDPLQIYLHVQVGDTLYWHKYK